MLPDLDRVSICGLVLLLALPLLHKMNNVKNEHILPFIKLTDNSCDSWKKKLAIEAMCKIIVLIIYENISKISVYWVAVNIVENCKSRWSTSGDYSGL